MTETTVHMIRLADGTLIDPLTRAPLAPAPSASESEVDSDGGSSSEVSSQEPSAPATIVPLARRSLLDLTLNKQQMAFVNNVLVYTLWGLPDDEIAIQCSCTVPDVLTVRDLDEYRRMHDALLAGMRHAYTSSAHGIISENAVAAARVVVSGLRSKSARAAFDAAKDILDRSGHRPADHATINVNLGKEADDALVIRVVRESDRPVIPTVDLRANGHGA